ncbi:MAG: V-type ATPase subunit, partial [Planctomycetota bacterium]
MVAAIQQPVLNFSLYPPVGEDDWRYAFATAQIRAMETRMLNRVVLLDMANADSFQQAVELLSSSEYAAPQSNKSFSEMENILLSKRSEVRELFKNLIIDDSLAEILEAREDFGNLKLALRRKLTDRPISDDYNNEGSVPAEQFQHIFEEENYTPLPLHMQEALESAVLAYYQNKEIRQIDYAIDRAQAEYKLSKAIELKNIFLEGLFHIQIDLANIRTMLRLKFTESDQRNVFLPGGYVEPDKLQNGLDTEYDAIAALFFATPYYDILNQGISYLVSNKSFLGLEYLCENYLMGFLKTTLQIAAGPQPIIAYLLARENEIRTI